RTRQARRKLAAMGYAEAVTWSFTATRTAQLFGGGTRALQIANPIAADLDCMRPSILPNLIEAAQRNADRGFADAALFEIGPVYRGDGPSDQAIVATALVAPHPGKRWDGRDADPLFELKGDLFDLLADLGAPVASLQIVQGQASPWFHPGRSALVQLGPKARIAEFGEVHPSVLKAMDADGPMYGFELTIAAIPEPKRKATKTKPALVLSPLMPLTRDFAFVVDKARPAGDLVRVAMGADKALIESARVFDLYEGKGVPEGQKSLAIEVVIQPKEATLTDAEIDALSARVVTAAEKLGARLRG
ncbi:MAG TPA: phenylalanine--tRNA ligase subunit beta, partial [Caulobacteraceae bacterium]|nr:phenylalanine--tRNA ligase subunit beta [Caulobacteraceae bacterium]